MQKFHMGDLVRVAKDLGESLGTRPDVSIRLYRPNVILVRHRDGSLSYLPQLAAGLAQLEHFARPADVHQDGAALS